MSAYVDDYLAETIQIAQSLDPDAIDAALKLLTDLRSRGGRLFVLGLGGSAANASHAVNDFRKIAHIEAYAPTDNVAELTAWMNDVHPSAIFDLWLTGSNLTAKDALLVLSVGGGSLHTSTSLVLAMRMAKDLQCPILSIVSRDGGSARELSEVCILVPAVCEKRITPHAEEFQAVIWHLLVSALAEES